MDFETVRYEGWQAGVKFALTGERQRNPHQDDDTYSYVWKSNYERGYDETRGLREAN